MPLMQPAHAQSCPAEVESKHVSTWPEGPTHTLHVRVRPTPGPGPPCLQRALAAGSAALEVEEDLESFAPQEFLDPIMSTIMTVRGEGPGRLPEAEGVPVWG